MTLKARCGPVPCETAVAPARDRGMTPHFQATNGDVNLMECKVKWIDGVSFVAETESGHALVMDGAPEGGGRNVGPRPMEMVLLGTGGCSAYDVVVILKKSGQEISGCNVELKAERAATDPKIFTRIHMHFVLRGRNLKKSMVESAIKLSHQKYCSASIMLGKTAEITHDYEIVAE
jgi:putative redox protein